ncbi:LysR substrate-binding domain-containing protein [Bariatricus sp. HCP3S3_E12]|uniref:LysR family transcriptional regulator n=1 Tax=Bariatricus sp. HCP3S3_E12 TaxID=3438906 RepID=UPI003F8A51EB
MNIKDFNVFITVAETRHLTKASKLLYMTPQGISKVIKNLENECDCELFLRTGNGMELSEAGRHFLKYANKAMEEYFDMRNELLRIKQKEHGVVDLLSAFGIVRLVTPECILDFKKKYPEIEFHSRECPDKQVERWFLAGEGNVAFSLAPCDEEKYDVSELSAFPVKLLVNENHPLSRKETVTIQDLRGEPLYIESREFKIHDLIVNKCREAGFEPNIMFETSGFSLCHKMVRENKGISVTVDFVSDDMGHDNMVLIPFADGDYEWKICMLTRKNETVGNGVDIFQKHVKEWMDRIREGDINR